MKSNNSANDLITAEEARRLFEYRDGHLWWKAKRWRTGPNKPAGTTTSDGYRQIKVNQKTYREHRLIWLIMYGKWPNNHIDHIDLNRSNNEITNLRECEARENCANTRVRSHSKSGLKGARFHRQSGKWQSRITLHGKEKCLGYFESAEKAHLAYCEAAKIYFGKFARFK